MKTKNNGKNFAIINEKTRRKKHDHISSQMQKKVEK